MIIIIMVIYQKSITAMLLYINYSIDDKSNELNDHGNISNNMNNIDCNGTRTHNHLVRKRTRSSFTN